MKKIFLFLGLLALPCAEAAADKKIQMVTYFPTPYVAYSEVQATDTLDVGLTGTCEMELGCDESGLALRASSAVVVQKGTFDLNAAGRVQSETVTLGKGGGAGTFDFDADLVVTTLQNGQSVEATNMQVDKLYLFPSHTSDDGAFPVCAGGTMSWQSVGGKTHLVCGDAPKVPECTKHAFNTDTRAEDAGYCCEIDGSVTFTNSSGNLEGWDKDVAEDYGYYCCDTLYVKTTDHDPNNPWIVYNPNQTYDPLGGIAEWSCTGNGSTESKCRYEFTHFAVTKNSPITVGMTSLENLAEQSYNAHGQEVECTFPECISCPSDSSCSQSTANSANNECVSKLTLKGCNCSYTETQVLESCTCTVTRTIKQCKCN